MRLAIRKAARYAALAAALALPLTAGACVSVTTNEYAARSAPRATLGDFGEATLVNNEGARIGRAVFTQGPTGVVIRIEAEGLTPGWHGVHLHATGVCEGPFTSAGGHINHGEPAAPHGLLNADGPDDGDLPNIFAGPDGRVNAEVFTTRARLAAEGPGQWLLDENGSAIVIHASADDHASQPIGGAGGRVACGVVAAG